MYCAGFFSFFFWKNKKNITSPPIKKPHWSKPRCRRLAPCLQCFWVCVRWNDSSNQSRPGAAFRKKGGRKKRKGNQRRRKKSKVEVQTPSVTYCQRMSRETAGARAAAVMLRRLDFRDDFSVIKSLTEGNKNPTVPSAAEKLKPCSHLFIISERARSQRRSPMAISVLPRFKLLAYTPRSTDLPELFLESGMERAPRYG